MIIVQNFPVKKTQFIFTAYNKNNMKKLGLGIFNVITTAAITIFRGFVISQLWSWFVVKQFGLNPLSIPMAIGLGILITMLTFNLSLSDITAMEDYNNTTDEEKFKCMLNGKFIGLFMPVGFLLTGWIVTLFL